MRNKNNLQGGRCPLFSVIVPVYQNQATLNECIDSVLRQQSQNYELILVDDGSTDESAKICDEYADRYSQIISVIHKSNEGPLLARLEGIQSSQGEYLLFLDADDTYVPGMLHKLEDIIRRQSADIIIFNYYRYYKNGKSELNKPLYTDGQIFEGQEKKKLYKELIAGFQLNALWQKCIRRETLGNLNDFLQFEEMVIGEDKMMSLEAVDRAEKIIYMADGLYNYRIVQSSISHSLSLKHYKDMDIVYRRTLEYMTHWRMDGYKALCSRRKAESGMSCLYSTACEIRVGKKSFKEFKDLASYIVSDKEYWNAFAECKKELPALKKMACRLMQNSHVKAVFRLMYIDDLLKSYFKKWRQIRGSGNED